MRKFVLTILIPVVLAIAAYILIQYFQSPVMKIARHFKEDVVIEKCTVYGDVYYRASQKFKGPDSINAFFYDTKGNQTGYDGGIFGGLGKLPATGLPTSCVTVYTKQ